MPAVGEGLYDDAIEGFNVARGCPWHETMRRSPRWTLSSTRAAFG